MLFCPNECKAQSPTSIHPHSKIGLGCESCASVAKQRTRKQLQSDTEEDGEATSREVVTAPVHIQDCLPNKQTTLMLNFTILLTPPLPIPTPTAGEVQ